MGVLRVRVQHFNIYGGGYDSWEIHCLLRYASRIWVSKHIKYKKLNFPRTEEISC